MCWWARRNWRAASGWYAVQAGSAAEGAAGVVGGVGPRCRSGLNPGAMYSGKLVEA